MGRKNKNVQIIAPVSQVKAFNSFCKSAGIKKKAFVIREMLFLIERETQAENKRTKAGAGSTPGADTD